MLATLPPAARPLSSIDTDSVRSTWLLGLPAPAGFHATLFAARKALMSAMVPSKVITPVPLPPTVTPPPDAALKISPPLGDAIATRTVAGLSPSKNASLLTKV